MLLLGPFRSVWGKIDLIVFTQLLLVLSGSDAFYRLWLGWFALD